MSSINITEVQGIMRMGVNQQSQLNSLLTYYRNKVEDCNRERQEWIAKYDECKFDADLKHKLQWENRHLKDKVEELERSLSHHKTALYDQRQNYLKLIKENAEFKKKQTEDSRKIQELINVCEPQEAAMIMCKDVKPELTNTFIVNDLNIHKSQNGSFGGSSLADRVKSANSTTAGGTTMKQKKQVKPPNVYLNPQTTSHQIHTDHELEIMRLKKHFDLEMGNLYEQNSVLKEELQKMRDKNQDKFTDQVENYKILLAKHIDMEKKHNGLAQEYFSIRMKLTENEQRVQQSNELLRVKNLFLAEKMKEQERKYQKESKAVQELVAKRNNDFKTKYKQQMRKKEEHLSILKQQYEKIQEIYLNKIKTLEQHLSKLNDKHIQLGKKSKREIAYLQAQLKVMEKRVQNEQVQKMRVEIQQLEEEERRKAQQQEKQEARQLKQRSDKKRKREKEIEKAYGVKEQSSPGRFKKSRRENRNPNVIRQEEDESEQEDQDDDSIEVNSQDIDNLQRHIQDLEQKLGLNK